MLSLESKAAAEPVTAVGSLEESFLVNPLGTPTLFDLCTLILWSSPFDVKSGYTSQFGTIVYK